MEGKTQQAAAAASATSERSVRRVAAWGAAFREEEDQKRLEDEAGPVRRCLGEGRGATAAVRSRW